MLVSITLNDKEEAIVTNFAKSKKMSISEIIRQAIFHQIEYLEELDLEEKLDEADFEAENTEKRYTSEEVFSSLKKQLNV